MLCVTLQSIVSPWALRWCFSIQTSGCLWSSKVFLIAHSFRVEKPFSSCFQLLMFILKHHFHLVSTVASREQHTGGKKKTNYFSPCVELSAIRTIQNNKMSQIRQDSKCVWWSCSNVEKGCQAPKSPCHVWWKSPGLFLKTWRKDVVNSDKKQKPSFYGFEETKHGLLAILRELTSLEQKIL